MDNKDNNNDLTAKENQQPELNRKETPGVSDLNPAIKPVSGDQKLPSDTPTGTVPVGAATSATPNPAAFPTEKQSGTPPPEEPTVTSSSESGQSSDDGDKKNLSIMIVALLILILVFLGLIYYFVMRQPAEPEQPTQQLPVETVVPSPTEAVEPTPPLTEEGLEEIEIGSPEADLSPVETELEQL